MSNTLEYTLGLDLAQASFDAGLAPQGCNVADWRELPHTHFDRPADSPEGAGALLAWLSEVAPQGRCLRVVVESTGALSLRVAVINPRRSKAFGDSLGLRDKTDRIDCAILSLFGMIHQPPPTVLGSDTGQQVRELNRLRQKLVEEQTAWKNRLGEAGSEAARKAIEKMLRHLAKQVTDLERQIDQSIAGDPALSLQMRALRQIKGVGAVIARTLTAELGDLRQYSRTQLVALAGLFPKQFESGTSVRRRPRLAKGGGSRLRRVLYMGASSLFCSTGPMRQWIETRLAQGQPKMAVEAMAMRKLLLIARAVMLSGGHYDPSKIGWQKA